MHIERTEEEIAERAEMARLLDKYNLVGVQCVHTDEPGFNKDYKYEPGANPPSIDDFPLSVECWTIRKVEAKVVLPSRFADNAEADIDEMLHSLDENASVEHLLGDEEDELICQWQPNSDEAQMETIEAIRKIIKEACTC